jgi:hypothetical protein
MRVSLASFITSEVIEALRERGYDIVKVGEAPPWMELVESLPAELYRRVATDV